MEGERKRPHGNSPPKDGHPVGQGAAKRSQLYRDSGVDGGDCRSGDIEENELMMRAISASLREEDDVFEAIQASLHDLGIDVWDYEAGHVNDRINEREPVNALGPSDPLEPVVNSARQARECAIRASVVAHFNEIDVDAAVDAAEHGDDAY